MKKMRHKKRKGFTLVELLVAIFIFLMTMTAVVAVFARQTANFKFLQVQQRNIENAQFVMNFMAKTLRTSSIQFDPNTTSEISDESFSTIYVFDHSQGLCFRFAFDTINKNLNITSRAPDPSDSFSCGKNAHYSSSQADGPYVYTTGVVEGHFKVSESLRNDPDTGSGSGDPNEMQVGLITMRMIVSDEVSPTSKPTVVQTSVSLRDYPAELTF